jgi:hypothetical protein
MLETVLQITGSIALASVSFAAAWFTYRSTRKRDVVTAEVSKEANAITWSKDLLGRVQTLETRDEERGKEITKINARFNKLDRLFRISINFTEKLLLWERDGSRPPRPNIPEDLKEYLDPSLIKEHARQQEELDSPKA